MSRVLLTNPFDLLTDENEDRTNVPAPKAKDQTKAPAKPAATGAVVAKPAAGAAKPAAPKTEQKGMCFDLSHTTCFCMINNIEGRIL